MWTDALLTLLAVALALQLRPWRAIAAGGPPWPWLACRAVLPLCWSANWLAASSMLQPLSGAPLLVLLAGWPLALLPVTMLLVVAGLPCDQALHRLVWLGLVPGTLALLLGAGLRRWLPRHLFIYILGRGFLATWTATALAGALALAWGRVAPPPGTALADLLLARFLTASGEAVITGMLVATFVAFRPDWLATYSDRLYLPED